MITPPRAFPVLVAAGLVACVLLASGQPALATNATNLLGYSAAAQGMAGAASVSVLDTSLINTNPASLFLLPDGNDRGQSAISGGIGGTNFGTLAPLPLHTIPIVNDPDDEDT